MVPGVFTQLMLIMLRKIHRLQRRVLTVNGLSTGTGRCFEFKAFRGNLIHGYYLQLRQSSERYPHRFTKTSDDKISIMPLPSEHIDNSPLRKFNPNSFAKQLMRQATVRHDDHQAQRIGMLVQGVGSGKTRKLTEIASVINTSPTMGGGICAAVTFNNNSDLEIDQVAFCGVDIGDNTRKYAASMICRIESVLTNTPLEEILRQAVPDFCRLHREHPQKPARDWIEAYIVELVTRINMARREINRAEAECVKTFVLCVDEALRAEEVFGPVTVVARHALSRSSLFPTHGFNSTIVVSSLALSPTGYLPDSTTKVLPITGDPWSVADVLACWSTDGITFLDHELAMRLLTPAAVLVADLPRLVQVGRSYLRDQCEQRGGGLAVNSAFMLGLFQHLTDRFYWLYPRTSFPSPSVFYHAVFALEVSLSGNGATAEDRSEITQLIRTSSLVNQITGGEAFIPRVSVFAFWAALKRRTEGFDLDRAPPPERYSTLLSFFSAVVQHATAWDPAHPAAKTGDLLEVLFARWERVKVAAFLAHMGSSAGTEEALPLARLYGLRTLEKTAHSHLLRKCRVDFRAGDNVLEVEAPQHFYSFQTPGDPTSGLCGTGNLDPVGAESLYRFLRDLRVSRETPLAYCKLHPHGPGDLLVAHLDIDGNVYVRVTEFKAIRGGSIKDGFRQAAYWERFLAYLKTQPVAEVSSVAGALQAGRYQFIIATTKPGGGSACQMIRPQSPALAYPVQIMYDAAMKDFMGSVAYGLYDALRGTMDKERSNGDTAEDRTDV